MKKYFLGEVIHTNEKNLSADDEDSKVIAQEHIHEKRGMPGLSKVEFNEN